MKVAYFVPCYIDALAPNIAISTYKLLQRFDIDLHYVEQPTCCGLPFTDMGYEHKACSIEKNFASMFEGFDAIVIPSGICTDQIRNQLTAIEQTESVKKLRSAVYDIVEFLHDVLQVKSLPWAHFPHKVALHNGCHSLRYLHHAKPTELMIPNYSKTEYLLSLVDGLEVVYATRKDECCGFGGTFAIWDVECSGQMGIDKVNDYVRNNAEYVTSADFSCLLHQDAIAKKNGINIKSCFIAEILNGDL
ncbi:MAG: (Fe-S)-binding protein [Tannerellaceae bacterium]